MKILIAELIDDDAIRWLDAQGAETIRGFEGEEWHDRADDIVGLIYRGALRIDAALMDQLPALKVIGKHGVGVNTIDLEAAAERGIAVTNTPGANANSVAEHAITLLTAITRGVVPLDRMVREGRFRERLSLTMVEELRGSNLGIVGGGRIGRRIAEIAGGGFRCEIGVYDPFLPDGVLDDLGVTMLDSLDALFEWAHNVVVAAPVTPQNRGSIGADQLRRLGATGSIVISSRGGIVDEAALVGAVRDGAIHGAGVDVFDPEPPNDDNPLFGLDRVVLTPHFGGHSERARKAMASRVAEQVWDHLHGREVPLVGTEPWLHAAGSGG